YSVAKEKADMEQAFSWMRTHVTMMPYLLSLHLRNMWRPYAYGYGLPFEEFPDRLSSKIVWDLIPGMAIAIFLLAALGLVVTWRRRKKDLLVVYLAIALTIAQNVVFYGSPRFRAPIEPLLVLLAGGAVWWLTCDEPGTLVHFRSRKGKEQEEPEPAPV